MDIPNCESSIGCEPLRNRADQSDIRQFIGTNLKILEKFRTTKEQKSCSVLPKRLIRLTPVKICIFVTLMRTEYNL